MKRHLLFAGMIIALFACGNDNETQKQRFLIRGNEALKQRNYREAIRVYEEAVNLDSCYVDAINNLGVVYFEQGQYEKAIMQYDQALLCQPDYFDALINRVNVFYELNELYRALDDLQYMERKTGDSSKVHFMLGLVHTKMRNYNEAITAFDKSLELDTANAETLINKGTVLYYQRQLSEAEQNLNDALKIDPLEPNAYNALSLIEVEKGNYAKALEMANQALDLETDQPYFLNNRGFIFLLTNELESARQDIDLSITKDPSNGWAYRNKGYYYYLNGEYEEALRLYQQASKLDPFIDKVFYFQGEAFLKLNKQKEACESFKKAKDNKESIGDYAELCQL